MEGVCSKRKEFDVSGPQMDKELLGLLIGTDRSHVNVAQAPPSERLGLWTSFLSEMIVQSSQNVQFLFYFLYLY